MSFQILSDYLKWDTSIGGSSNNDGINLSGNLYTTGSNLYNNILGLSGMVVWTTGTQGVSGIKTFGNILLAGMADVAGGTRAGTDSLVVKGSSQGGQVAWFYDFNSIQPYLGIECKDNSYTLLGTRPNGGSFILYSNSTGSLRIENNIGFPGNLVGGKIGLAGDSPAGGAFKYPTATIHLGAGGQGGNSSPMKFTSGFLLITPENGALEYDGRNLFITNDDLHIGNYTRAIITTGRSISTLSTGNSSTLYSGDITVSGAGGILTTINNNLLTISGSTLFDSGFIPQSYTDNGRVGQVALSGSHLHICTGQNAWGTIIIGNYQ